MKKVFSILLSTLLLYACVPNKKITYLQKQDIRKQDMPSDTVLRTYPQSYEPYRIHPYDVLYVDVKSLTSSEFDIFSQGQNANVTGNNVGLRGKEVSPDGYIHLPVIGKIKVAGLSIFEVKNKLDSAAAAYVEDPIVTVRLLNFRFTVLGEVQGEGNFSTSNDKVTIMEAMGIAGGLTELADRSKIKVIRQVDGSAKVFYLNLLKEQALSDTHFYVYPNDIIVVPPLRQRTFKKYYRENVGLVVSTMSLVLLVFNLLTK